MRVAVVNEDFVNTYLHGSDPLLQRLSAQFPVSSATTPAPPTELQIIGVYHDVRTGGLREHHPEMQVPFWQCPSTFPTVAVRTPEDPASMLKSVAAAVHSIDPEVPLAWPRTMEQVRNSVLGYDRFSMILFICFGVVALLLAALGIYGVMSFTVAQRSHEIALRIALGADRTRVVVWVVRQGVLLALLGLSLGLAGAYGVGRVMQSTLFDMGVIDYPVLCGAAIVLLMAALLASLLPARRAAIVEPMRVLNAE